MSINISSSNMPGSTTGVGINNSLKSLFISEGENLINSTAKCEELWEEMRKADFRKEGVLNEKNIQLVYEKKKKMINDFLKISSAEEFLLVFDDDCDGFLNEDEQILVFSVIKERIQIIAEELCSLKKYELYKDLMKEVRAIEGLINKFQNELRQNVHKKQLEDYINIGIEMQHDFTDNWSSAFDHFEQKSEQDYRKLDVNLKKINDLVYQKEANKIQAMKLKPSHQIKLLHNQEKLVAINERVEEAANFRNELHKLIKHDELRLEKLKNEKIRNLNHKLEKDERYELKKKSDRIEKERNKLIISKNKQTDILSKQINLHINDIVRIQNSLSNMYTDIGKKEDELKRVKERQRNTNKTIAAFKSIKSYSLPPVSNVSASKHDLALALLNLPSKNLSLNSSMESTGMSKLSNMKKNVIALKFIIKSFKLTRFDINSEFNSRKFCNVPEDSSIKNDNNLKKKIRKLLEQRKHKDEIMIPPSLYYDNNMNLVTSAREYRDLLPKLNSTKSVMESK